MKVINLHNDQNVLIQEAIANNRQAQHVLYHKYAGKMLSVCRQYINDVQFAEDIMVTGFMKVFANLHKYENKGSFEGWIRRIMIHECIDYIRVKKNAFKHQNIDDYQFTFEENENELEQYGVEQIQSFIDNLPDGYKVIFNLYAIEGYKHQEIAKMLNIAEGTSKSQLAQARKMLQKQITELKNTQNGTK
jgi:RNA polymerase sigma-70 factor, ECF subfamily